MLVAPQAAAEPAWLTIGTAKVLFVPIDRQMMRRARRAALRALERPEDDAVEMEDLGDELSYALITAGARDWQDVVRVAEDGTTEPLPFTSENLARVLSDPVFFDAFDAAYVMPFATREREKNALAGSPNGTGGKATPAPITADRPAGKSGGAESAPTASTKSKTKRSSKPSKRSPIAGAS